MSTTMLFRLLLLGMIWGASFLFQRIAVPVVGAGTTAAFRMILAALTMAAVLALLGKPLEWRRRWKDYVVIGTLVSALPFLCFAFGARVLPAGYLAVINATTPMFTVLLSGLAGARPSVSKWVGVLFGFLGVFTLARFGAVGLNLASVLAFAAVLLAAFLYAFTARAIAKRFADADPLVVASGNLIGGSLPMLPVAALSLPAQFPSWGVVGAIVTLGVVCTAFAYALHFRNIREAGSERAVTVTLFVPVFAQIWGAIFLGEAITWASVAGSALVLFAVALIFEMIRVRRPAPAMKLLPRECS